MFTYDTIKADSINKNLNDLTFSDYFYRLMLLARSVFKWENLPNGIDEKWIERFLFTEGRCMFFKDETKGYMITRCTPSGMLNHYDEPTMLTPYGTNLDLVDKKPKTFNEDCVLIRNNDEMIPTAPTIQLYALRLAEITRTIDINIVAQQTPTLILCSDKQRCSLKQVYKQWKGHEPVIYGDKSLDLSQFQVLKTDAPVVFPELQVQKHEIWNECLTFMGINNCNSQKKERLVNSEVHANDEQIEASANVMLKSRQKACELINKKYGLNIQVGFRNINNPVSDLLDGVQNVPVPGVPVKEEGAAE